MADNPLVPCAECGEETRAGIYCLRCQTGGEVRTEKTEQNDVFEWLKARGVEPIRIANERARKRKWDATKGVADFLIMDFPPLVSQRVSDWQTQREKCGRGIFVEMKQAKGNGSKHGQAQKEFAEKCAACGYLYLLCNGAEDAIKQLTMLGF